VGLEGISGKNVGLIFVLGSGFLLSIQLREKSFHEDRPRCPSLCARRLHRHGHYERFKDVRGQERRSIPRYYCPGCGRTVSVVPEPVLPYRAIDAHRLQSHFDQKAEGGTGPDPPPGITEAGCLERAWSRFSARSAHLRHVFGQLVSASIQNAADLWQEMRRSGGTVIQILHFLADTRNLSLLGDYACLKAPPV